MRRINLLLPFVAVMLASCVGVNKSETFVGSVRVDSTDTPDIILSKAANIVPTPRQLAAIDNEFIAFVHFGPNTFTRREWGTGFEDPAIFDLHELHTDEWCSAMKDAGMTMVILTVKHHDGFCLWQTRYTKHGIMSSPYKDGKGDVLRELSESCQRYGLKLGVYLSPADLFQIESPDGIYGNLSEKTLRTIPREVEGRPFANKTTFQFTVDDYNEYFLSQLFELLTEYGPISEVWFDGAHPKRKGGQTYNYTAWRELIRTLAPDATVFGREDIRWCGNEGGFTRDAEFNVITYNENPSVMTEFYDIYGEPGAREVYLNHEKPFWLHYQPAETNTSIRSGWFYSDDDYQRVRTADEVFDIWERSVGGNSIFLLNIPPNREGRFSGRDAAVLREVGRRIRATYGEECNLLANGKGKKALLDGRQETYCDATEDVIITLPEPVTLNRIVLREPIATVGERVERLAADVRVNGEWREVTTGTNIGNRRILRFEAVTGDAIRIRILETRATPLLSSIEAYFYDAPEPEPAIEQQFLTYFTAKEHNVKVNLSSTDNPEDFTDNSFTDTLTFDLNEPTLLKGFAAQSMVSKGIISISDDGENWSDFEPFEFGNLINDPTQRLHVFHEPVKTRYIRFVMQETADGSQPDHLHKVWKLF